VTLRNVKVRTASELFAVTADVNLLLGNIAEADYACDTPDGAPKTKKASALRLARVVCCDLDELQPEEAAEIANQAYREQLDELKAGIREVSACHGLQRAAVCGLGDFIAMNALDEMGIPYTAIDKRVSRIFPAYAVAKLLERSR